MQKFLQQTLDMWKKLNIRQKAVLVGMFLTVFIGIIVLATWAGQPDYTPIATDLTIDTAAQVTAKLDAIKIVYKVSDDETTVSVASKDKHTARMALATGGVLGTQNIGFALFDQTKMGTTDFERRVNYLRAIQGELETTIGTINGVKANRVHITIPDDSLFQKDQKPAKASVTLQMKPGAKLTAEEVTGIVNLVVSAVSGLDPKNVVIIDSSGNILSDQRFGDDSFAGGQGATKQLQIQDDFNKQAEGNIQTMLEQVLGPGKVVVRVNAVLDFDKQEISKDTYVPVIGDNGIARSVEQLQQNSGSSSGASGAPGTSSNPPTYPTGGTSGGAVNEQYQTKTSYEISNVKEQQSVAPGSVKRMTVTVIVDNEMTQKQLDAITRSVSDAAGIDQQRGDRVTILGIPYDRSFANAAQTDLAATSHNKNRDTMIFVFEVLGMLLAFYLMYRALFGNKEKKRLIGAEDENMGIDFLVGDEPLAPGMMPKLSKLSPEELEKQKLVEEIEELARKNPQDVASLIRTWMVEDEE